MRGGFVPIAHAAAHLGIGEDAVLAAAKAGALTVDNLLAPREVSAASVLRMLESRHARFGAFAMAVAHADGPYGRPALDQLGRFYAAGATTFGNEGTGADGGFLVPADQDQELKQPFADGAFNLPSMCSQFTTTTNNTTVVINRRPFHDTTGGVQAHFVGEGEPIPQSKPKLETSTTKLGKLVVLLPVTEELFEDAPALGAYLMTAARGALIYKATEAILRGHTGVALGVLQSPALIAVPAEAGQTADTILAENVAKALSRIAAESLPTTIAIAHPDAHEFILRLALTGGAPVANLYQPADADAPAGRICGRRLVISEAASKLGDVGDLLFVDPLQIQVSTKDPQSRALTSIHIWFDRAAMAFKTTMRFAAQPMWGAPVQSRDSANFRSPFTTIAAR